MSNDRRHLPVSYEDPINRQHVPGKGFAVTAQEIKQYASGKICGNCAYFAPEHAVGEMVRTEFMPKLVKELEWKPEHLGAALTSESGLCEDRGDMLTATFTAACENWRETRGKLRRQSTSSELETLEAQRRTMLRLNRERMEKQRREHLKRIMGQR